ncbi:RNA 2',3'-cyclic phosphodiesterase [Deinococcus malanensis]|uniref:RNA 2',3'-cyclic phosphodiesterase n=1 Tax=Deinococcus malanensis TaxID=1706855 RepID=UPI003642A40A
MARRSRHDPDPPHPRPAPRADKPQRNTEPATQPLGPDIYEPAKATIQPAAAPARRTGAGRPDTDEASERTLRLFYALRVPTDISTPLAEAQRALRGNWRAVRPDQMHVTLAYLPAVPPERLDDLKRLGALLTQDVAPMEVRLRGTGYFPNEGSPRVWFAKVEAEGLTEFATRLREGIQNLDIQTDNLPFKAHITMARKKGPAPGSHL